MIEIENKDIEKKEEIASMGLGYWSYVEQLLRILLGFGGDGAFRVFTGVGGSSDLSHFDFRLSAR